MVSATRAVLLAAESVCVCVRVCVHVRVCMQLDWCSLEDMKSKKTSSVFLPLSCQLKGEEAAKIGLVDEVVDQNDAGDAAYHAAVDMARKIVPQVRIPASSGLFCCVAVIHAIVQDIV